MITFEDQSYGIVPVFMDKGEFLFLLVHHKGDHWAFPKGHKNEGETDIEAARRELFEETGVWECRIRDIPVIQEFYTFEHKGKVIRKTVDYFVGFADDTETETPKEFSGEIEEIRWLPFSEAMDLLTYQSAKRVLENATEKLRMMARHFSQTVA